MEGTLTFKGMLTEIFIRKTITFLKSLTKIHEVFSFNLSLFLILSALLHLKNL
jgi:hypothetical protein